MNKTCSRCNQDKLLNEFAKDKNRKDGYYPICKECVNKKAKEVNRTSEAKAKRVEYQKQIKADPVRYAQRSESSRKRYSECKDDPEFREKQRARQQKYDKSELGLARHKRFQQSPRRKDYMRQYAQEKGIPKAKERYHSDPEFRDKQLTATKQWTESEKGQEWQQEYYQSTQFRELCKQARERQKPKLRERYNNDLEYHAKIRAKNNARIERERASGGDLNGHDWQFLAQLAEGKCLCCGNERKLAMDHIVPIGTGNGKTIVNNIQPLCVSCNSRKGKQFIDYRSNEYKMKVDEYIQTYSKET